MNFKRKIKTTAVVMLLILALTGKLTVLAGEDPAYPPSPADQGQPRYYTVKRGDCLWTVADRFGINEHLLALTNGLDPESSLLENQKLVIPAGQEVAYIVTAGDTLWDIARRFNTTVKSLAEENGLVSNDPLLIGRPLAIPATGREITTELNDYDVRVPEFKFWPVTGQVSSVFGPRAGRTHEGLDVAAEEGKPIRAIDAGVVVFAGWRGTYGYTVIINHGRGVRSLYAHASTLEVSPGECVEQGQTIARIGSTGHSTGPHLHLELLYGGVPLNPQNYLPGEDRKI